ncbi:ABC transporter permease [Brevundimonas vesicularis]|uniref:ABC transporter permease n=1 Tax=Brevundimonas vesicularis TaxID=41276 RepID=UPI0038D4B87A
MSNLRGQGRRSVLALLGVVIGSAAIVALLNVAHIAQCAALTNFRQTGVDMLLVRTQGGDDGALAIPDLLALVDGDPDAVSVAPFASLATSISMGRRVQTAQVGAVTPVMNTVLALSTVEGRLLRHIDQCVAVTVLGSKLAQGLSSPGAEAISGGQIFMEGYGFTVVGVLRPVPIQALSPFDYDNAALIPLGCARRIMPNDGATGAVIRLEPGADTAAAVSRYTAALATPQTPVQVQDAKTLIEAMKKQMAMLGGVLVAIGSISLLVGGVGVMNVMLMTVMERRREIGLRAAIGATPGDIRMMFLIEAVVLAVGGGLVGDVLGVGLTWAATLFLPFDFAVSWTVLCLGVGVAAGVGLVFGLYPAIAASRIQPIEALRGD